ncbi:hypothetical protein GCM10028819_21100 [Spirosoma humi]
MNQTLQAGALYFLEMLHNRRNSPSAYRQPGTINQDISATVTFPTNLGNVVWIDRKALAQSNEAGQCTDTFF